MSKFCNQSDCYVGNYFTLAYRFPCHLMVRLRVENYEVFLSQFSFKLQCLQVYTALAVLPDPTFCKQPKHCLKQQCFGHLQNVGSGNNPETVYSATYKHCSLKLNLFKKTSQSFTLVGLQSTPFGIPFRLPVPFQNRGSSLFIICK